jgi:serine protease Do
MNETLFCERNVKVWITPLFLFAIFVLGFSIRSAMNKGKINISDYYVSIERREPFPSNKPNAAPPLNTPFSDPAAQHVALTNPYCLVQTGQGGTSIYPTTVDPMTWASPMSDIQLIAGTPVEVQNPEIFPDFNRAADIIRPCVVNVNAIRPTPLSQQVANPNAPRFIEPFDGVPDKFIGEMAFESVGSGVIVDSSGYVVTNHHVVSEATAIIVSRFRHEGQYAARILASDPKKDLALLQIQDKAPFPTAILADSSQVEVGDWVMAVGNPFGLEHTVTAGIVSGKRSSIVIDGVKYKGLIQTDAPINKGSSGGPLVNVSGQVVGINTAIYAPTGVFNGTGFAIPSNQVGAFVARFTENRKVAVAMQRPFKFDFAWLGVGVIDMNPDLADKLSYPYARGIYVNTLVLDSPADKAEITRGDIITAVSGETIQDTASLKHALAGLKPGQVVTIAVWRGGKTETLKLKAGIDQRKGM